MSKSVGCVAWRGEVCIYIYREELLIDTEIDVDVYVYMYILIYEYIYMNTHIWGHVQERRVRGLERGSETGV